MSLNLRIILSATLVLAIFISLTALTLERAYSDSAETALRDRLTSQLYALMAAAEVDDSGHVSMPSSELDALLGLPSSGMYAAVTGPNGELCWQSSSTLGAGIPEPRTLTAGEKRFARTILSGTGFYSIAYGVNWASDTGTIALTFNLITDLESFDRQIAKFRHSLWGWLGAMAALLLLSQAAILRWGLSPLRKVGRELNRIEAGHQDLIHAHYPHELKRLTDNINQLLRREREQKTRYRNALGDLAHSLKTPLAVLHSTIEGKPDSTNNTLQEQISRMNSIVEYQLQRAATAGSAGFGKHAPVAPVVSRLIDSLNKVYRDKAVDVHVNVEPSLAFRGDADDLMEILGNLLDNAYKWCRKRIDVSAGIDQGQLVIDIRDDGPGMAAEQVDSLLERGARADPAIAGHGIGLSIVQNIVDAYKGVLTLEPGLHGGLSVRVRF